MNGPRYTSTPIERIRNVAIIAHIDHGKSTLADRMLELCGAVDPREMRRNTSIGTSNAIGQHHQVQWCVVGTTTDQLIDPTGHVDFDRCLALAGAWKAGLLVDEAQGIEARPCQCYLLLESNLGSSRLNKSTCPRGAELARRSKRFGIEA